MEEIEMPYDKIAEEYYDEIHITSRNFDEISKHKLRDYKIKIPKEGLVLEIGAGKGRSNEFLDIENNRIIQIDNSIKMLSINPREESLIRIHADASKLPFLDSTFSVITSFLCDPFFGLEFLSEVYRVLKVNGIFIFTLPSFTWGKSLREEIGISINETRFKNKKNDFVIVPSILVRNEQILEMLKYVGFNISNIEINNLKLPIEIKSISEDIIKSAKRQNINPFEIGIISLIYVNKK